jgi:3'(2'), 5'-bisphosphate nucleotidase
MSKSEWIERDLALAIHAARTAGVRVESLRQSGRWSEESMRADIGDQAADGYLRGLIEGRYPEDGVLSEETADSPERLKKSRVWIIDPLDGTKEYSQLREDWAVHVALCIDGACALAAVALPATGQVLWGVALEAERRAGVLGGGELLAGDSAQPRAPRMVVSRSHTPEWTAKFAQLLGVAEQLPTGSVGFKAACLLLGRADVYVHKKGLKEWDTCAPEVIARAMGWSVCKLRGDEHRYNRADPKNHELVMCRPALKPAVLAALEQSGALEA